MGNGLRVRHRWAAVLTTAALWYGCGGDAGLTINSPSACNGGGGVKVTGAVQMPHGRIAQADGVVERVASALWSEAAAITGAVSSVGGGKRVELIELRQEDLDNGTEPGPVAIATTDKHGEFCMELPAGTDENVCRYVVQVGDSADRTLTRAFVFSTSDPINIDFRSEATVRVILTQIPPAGLCEFSPDDIANIYNAVVAAPGTATGATADEINAVAASIAAADPGVDATLSAAVVRPPTATATQKPSPPTATPTGPTPTKTAIQRATDTAAPRPTRTPVVNTPTATPPHTRTPTAAGSVPPTRTPTATVTTTGAPTNTAIPRTNTPAPTNTSVAATATRPPATATVPPTSTVAIATATALVATAVPTPTNTPGTVAELGERVFTIREDSQYPPAPPNDPRTGFFSSGLGGFSVSDTFSSGPLVFVAAAPNANGIAEFHLKQDAYFKINVPPGGTALCVKMFAAGSTGSIDCDGGTPYGVLLSEAAGDTPPGTPQTGQGTDSGPGAAQFTVMQSIFEIGMFDKACDASVTFSDPTTAIYTTATYKAVKGPAQISKSGENFSCANWTTTNGPGMLVTGVVSFETRGGNAANATRLADN